MGFCRNGQLPKCDAETAKTHDFEALDNDVGFGAELLIRARYTHNELGDDKYDEWERKVIATLSQTVIL